MKSGLADLAVRGGVLVNGRGFQKADLFIRGGTIDSLESPESPRPAVRTIDASGKYVLPGIIDAHLHPVYADHIETLSQAAAFGGTTTLIPYIGAVKAWSHSGTLFDVVGDFIRQGEKDSFLDFGIHGSLMPDDLAGLAAAIPRLIDMGVTSFKAFMAYERRGMMLSDGALMTCLDILAKSGALLAVHAENGSILDGLEDRFRAAGRTAPEDYPPTHPNLAEAEAVFRILTLSRIAKCPLYLPHISAHESLDVIRLFKKWGGTEFFAETCPHYLVLTEEEMIRRGSLAKMAPPLRKAEDLDALWKSLGEGLIDVVGSDAAGHLIKTKEPLWEKIFDSPYGSPGVNTLFPVVYDEGVNRGRITLPRLVALMCENPARIFGLAPRKGFLNPGSDADVLILDPGMPHEIKGVSRPLKVDYSLFEGRRCLGLPVLVMQRGEVLVEDGAWKAEAVRGRYLPRRKFMGEEGA
ncbi:MAG: amidohydrolase family protein [Candidatus Aminicenantes bacterium]|nr:amidohydrolase family protein [Candidatus Aminicenantes bacterium]